MRTLLRILKIIIYIAVVFVVGYLLFTVSRL